MTEPAAGAPDEVEGMVDELLDGLPDLLPKDMRADARDYVLDAFAAHPVARLLGERLRSHAAPSRSGEEPIGGAAGSAPWPHRQRRALEARRRAPSARPIGPRAPTSRRGRLA
jgi:hypothetical protein